MPNYKFDFNALKAKVGIDDIAYLLGYRLDRHAGVGRYVEYVLGNGDTKQDTIIIGNQNNKAQQFYFRRNGDRGDVISFVKEKLHLFPTAGKTQWEQIGNVLANLANVPVINKDNEYISNIHISKDFDASRYLIKPVYAGSLRYIFDSRAISADTVGTLKDSMVLIRDTNAKSFNGYNIGFPYRTSPDGDVEGYEIRGANGFKSKATGTNSSSALWYAVNPKVSGPVKQVYFFESAFDALAFYQVHAASLKSQNFALVSVGGQFSKPQISNALNSFPDARPYDCFDNDITGVLYGIKLACYAENIDISIRKVNDNYKFSHNGKSFLIPANELTFANFAKNIHLKYKMGQAKAPDGFKDWNDVIINPQKKIFETPSKLLRDENLRNNRNKMKL